jgi:phosphate uptake regulator
LSKTPQKRQGELRRLQVTGGSTYILSLPKKWITRNQLSKGNPLLLTEEEDGSLTISLQSKTSRRKALEEAIIRVASNDSPQMIVRKAFSSYLVGYNMIHVKALNQMPLTSKQRNTIKDFARRLLVGTEIVADTPNELVLQVLLSYPELSIQSALRRMSIITSSMHKDAMTALKSMDLTLAKSVVSTDDEVDRFNLFVVRQLKTAIENPAIIREIGLKNARECLGYRLVTKSVERAADHAASIAEQVLFLKKSIGDEILRNLDKMSGLAVSMFETAIESLFRMDFNLAENVLQKTREIDFTMKEALVSSKGIGTEEVANLRLVIESLKRTAEYGSDIAEIVLNLTVQSVLE